MSLPDQPRDLLEMAEVIAAFLLASAAILLRGGRAAVMVLTVLGPLFLTYKHSIVRPDGHLEILFTSLPLLVAAVAIWIPFEKRDGPAAAALLLLVAFWLPRQKEVFSAAHWKGDHFGMGRVLDSARSLPFERLQRELDGQMRVQLAPDIIPGLPSDLPMAVFPMESAYAAANHFPLRISPVPQAYSAYTAFLDEKCARFLEPGATAPPRILFDWSALDGRHPLLDVPAWSLAMFRHYGVEEQIGSHAVLKRLAQPRFGTQWQAVRTEHFRLDQPVRMDTSRPLVARIRLRWNLRGAVLKFAYKAPELRLALGGLQHSLWARVIPETLADGVMANFEPRDLAAWLELLRDGRVGDPYTEMRFSGPALADLEAEGDIEWFEIPGLPVRLERPMLPVLTMRPTGVTAAAMIEGLAERGLGSVGPDELVLGSCPGFVPVQGWAFDEGARKRAAAVYVDIDGVAFEADYGGPRPDVAELFHNPELTMTGYGASIPLASVGPGEHRLRVRVVANDGRSVSDGEQSFRFRCDN